MNEALMKKFKEEDSDFDKRIVLREAEEIEFDRHNSQIRKLGHVQKKASKYAGTFTAHGDKFPEDMPPVTVNKNGVLIDGCTRVLGAIKNGKTLVPTYEPLESDQWTRHEEKVYQAKANNHKDSTPNTEEDIEWFIESERDYLETHVAGFAFPVGKGKEVLKDFTDKVYDYLTQDENTSPYYQHHKNKNWFTNRIKKAFTDPSAVPYANPSDDEVIRAYKAKTGKMVSGVGPDGSTASKILRICKTGRFTPNMDGYVLRNSIDHPGKETDIVFVPSTSVGTTPIDIIEDRMSTYADFKSLKDTMSAAGKRVGNIYTFPVIMSGRYYDGDDLILMDEEWYSEAQEIADQARKEEKINENKTGEQMFFIV